MQGNREVGQPTLACGFAASGAEVHRGFFAAAAQHGTKLPATVERDPVFALSTPGPAPMRASTR